MPDAELKPRFDDVLALGPHGFTRVAYAEWGDPNAEQVVICVHGLTRNCRDFDFLARRLAHRGLRVIAPDLPGRGKSQWVITGYSPLGLVPRPQRVDPRCEALRRCERFDLRRT